MAYKKKYRPGNRIYEVLSVVWAVENEKWLYLNHKPLHPKFVSKMPLDTIIAFLKRGAFRTALLNKEG